MAEGPSGWVLLRTRPQCVLLSSDVRNATIRLFAWRMGRECYPLQIEVSLPAGVLLYSDMSNRNCTVNLSAQHQAAKPLDPLRCRPHTYQPRSSTFADHYMMKAPCCTLQRMHGGTGGLYNSRALRHPFALPEARWTARQPLSRQPPHPTAVRPRCSVVLSAAGVTEVDHCVACRSAPSLPSHPPCPVVSLTAPRISLPAAVTRACRAASLPPAQAGKQISKVEIPAFIPRPDLLEQLVRRSPDQPGSGTWALARLLSLQQQCQTIQCNLAASKAA